MLKEAKVTMGIQFNDSFGGIGKYFPSHNMIIIILVFSLFIRHCDLLRDGGVTMALYPALFNLCVRL